MLKEFPKEKVFESTSSDNPKVLHVSFASDPHGSLGCTLAHCDKGEDVEMFMPSYAQIAKLLTGETVARKFGVQKGDFIVAVNGQGFRRFSPDYEPHELEVLTVEGEENTEVTLDNKVLSAGGAYDALLTKIKAVKGAAPDPPLILSFERCCWDARPHAWARFLAAREGTVPLAMQMMQEHAAWKAARFPIDLRTPGLQAILYAKAISEIDVGAAGIPPTVYVNYGKLLEMQAAEKITAEDVVAAFVIFTERMLEKAEDPRQPKTCQFIDLSGAGYTSGLRADTLKQIYNVFEPNYPETLCKMVMYPVSTLMSTTARTLLSFVNENTKEKFVLTNKLDKVCEEMGWNEAEVEACGGVNEYMRKHEKVGDSLLAN